MKTKSFLTFILALTFAAAPFVTSPFMGFTEDQLPIPQIDPPVQPAGYAFAIWGLIYLWLALSAGFGLLRRADAIDWDAARLPLIISLAIGTPWLAIANASAIWATVTIILMAATAMWALILTPILDRWLFQAPVAIYAGWLTAASAVSIATTMAGYGILFDAYLWAIIGISLALIVAVSVYLTRPSAPEYLATVIWALVGVIVANGLTLPVISGIAALGIAILLALTLAKRASWA